MKQNPQPAIPLIESQGDLFDLGSQKKPFLLAKGARPGPPAPVSYRTALRQITRTVLEDLKARGEQWEAGPRQDLISTLFIAAAKEKRITFDFYPEER